MTEEKPISTALCSELTRSNTTVRHTRLCKLTVCQSSFTC